MIGIFTLAVNLCNYIDICSVGHRTKVKVIIPSPVKCTVVIVHGEL